MPFPPELLALGVILIFGGLVYLMIRASRSEGAEKTARALRLGFQPLADIPPELLNRVEELYKKRAKQDLQIRNLFQLSNFSATIYLFDLVDTEGDDTWLATDSFGIIARSLALPRFFLTTIPEFNRERGLGKMMDGLLDKVLDLAARQQDLTRIEFPEISGFDDRFVVYGSDESAVRRLVSGIGWESLTRETAPLLVQGAGDFLNVEYSYSAASGDKFQNLQALYRMSTDLLRRLEK